MNTKSKLKQFRSGELFDRGALNMAMIEMEEVKEPKEPIIMLEGKDANALRRFWNDAPMNNLKDIEDANVGAAKFMKDIEARKPHTFVAKKPTLEEVNKMFEKPRSSEWDDKRVGDFKFNTPEQQAEKIRRNIIPKQQAFKDNAREKYYKEDLMEKMFQANIDAQNRATEQLKSQQTLAQQQFNQNQQLWDMQQKQRIKIQQAEKIKENYVNDTTNLNILGADAGLDPFVLSRFNQIKRKRAQEELDALV